MDPVSIVFVVVFTAAALVPAVWSIVGLATGHRGYLWGVIGAAWAAVWMVVFFSSMAADWGGCEAADEGGGVAFCGDIQCPGPGCNDARDPCSEDPAVRSFCEPGVEQAHQYCETVQEGSVAQPWSTWSDLAFVASGLWILWWLGFAAARNEPATNPSVRATPLSVTYGLVVVFMGPASMLLHASLKSWAGWFDAFSVYTWLSLCGSYTMFAAWGWSADARQAVSLAVWGGVVLVLGIWSGFDAQMRFIGIVVGAGFWIVAEVVQGVSMAVHHRIRRDWIPWGIMVGLIVVAMVFWMIYNPEINSLDGCRFFAPFPGHAVFHILAAVGTFLLFACWRTEQPDHGGGGRSGEAPRGGSGKGGGFTPGAK